MKGKVRFRPHFPAVAAPPEPTPLRPHVLTRRRHTSIPEDWHQDHEFEDIYIYDMIKKKK
jgi:hypothetical protein